MLKKLYISQIISTLAVTKPLSTIVIGMHNFIAKFRNILEICKKFAGNQVNESGNVDSTTIRENLFFAPEPSAFNLTESTNNLFEKNYYLGTFQNMPVDSHSHDYSAYYESIMNSKMVLLNLCLSFLKT